MAKKHRFNHVDFEVQPGRTVNLSKWSTKAGKNILSKGLADEVLAADVADLQRAQELLYASNRYSMLVILQGMDTSGKDGVIRHVMSGVNPLGCRAYAFKTPNEQELQHHFLWRPAAYLPARGMICLFNRSYYEEVMVVRVHPQFLEPQRLPQLKDLKEKSLDKLWRQRYREINAFERALVRNGTLVLKFFLHLSPDVQKQRLLERIRQPEKNWKFNPRDLHERQLWPAYQTVFEAAFKATSSAWAPWYIIPADDKWYTRAVIADIVAEKLSQLKLSYPEVTDDQRKLFAELARELQAG